jgi:hypothetical protein
MQSGALRVNRVKPRHHLGTPEKSCMQTRKTRKIGSCPFFNWNLLTDNPFLLKYQTGILRILRKILRGYTWGVNESS